MKNFGECLWRILLLLLFEKRKTTEYLAGIFCHFTTFKCKLLFISTRVFSVLFYSGACIWNRFLENKKNQKVLISRILDFWKFIQIIECSCFSFFRFSVSSFLTENYLPKITKKYVLRWCDWDCQTKKTEKKPKCETKWKKNWWCLCVCVHSANDFLSFFLESRSTNSTWCRIYNRKKIEIETKCDIQITIQPNMCW